MYEFLTALLAIVGVLQILLFFKIWGMTNDIHDLKEHFLPTKKVKADEIDVDKWISEGNNQINNNNERSGYQSQED